MTTHAEKKSKSTKDITHDTPRENKFFANFRFPSNVFGSEAFFSISSPFRFQFDAICKWKPLNKIQWLYFCHIYILAIEFCVIVFLRIFFCMTVSNVYFSAWIPMLSTAHIHTDSNHCCEVLPPLSIRIQQNISFEYSVWDACMLILHKSPKQFPHQFNICMRLFVCLVCELQVCNVHEISVCKLYFGFYVLFHALSIRATTTTTTVTGTRLMLNDLIQLFTIKWL